MGFLSLWRRPAPTPRIFRWSDQNEYVPGEKINYCFDHTGKRVGYVASDRHLFDAVAMVGNHNRENVGTYDTLENAKAAVEAALQVLR